MRQLATIQQIDEIKPIQGADAIEAVRVNGWWMVAKKDEFKVNDPCLYFELDSLLPVDNPAFAFLAKGSKTKEMTVEGKTYTGYRLKTIRLKGQVSQGLALPITLFCENCKGVGWTTEHDWPSSHGEDGECISCPVQEPCSCFIGKIGEDISERLGIVKYEPPISAQLSGQVKGNFPGFLPKTDEERVQNMEEIIKRHVGEEFYVTEKLDGSSMTVYKKDGLLGVCSRNLELLETEGNTLWKLANRYSLKEHLPDGFAIQGEAVGEGIQSNPLKLKGQDFFVYNVYDFVNAKYLDYDAMRSFCDDLNLETVPIIDAHFTLDEFYSNVPNLLTLADGVTYLNTNPETGEGPRREGIVIRPVKEQREVIRGTEQRFSFKVISNEYLLNEKE